MTVDQYLAELPEDRCEAMSAVREVILKNLPEGYEEGIQYRHIGYFVPHTIYPAGYHCDPTQPLPFMGLASTKSHMALHAFCLYADEKVMNEFQEAYRATGKKLDMGKSCIRFKKLEHLPLELIGELVAKIPVDKFVANYEQMMPENRKKK